jgi:opacity protein-like surface antigen
MEKATYTKWIIGVGALACLVLAGPLTPATSQPASGAIVSGIAAATVFDNTTETSISGAIGYRLNRAIGFGIELTYVPSLEPSFPFELALPRPGIRFQDQEGNGVFFTSNVRLEIPTTVRRVVPYVVAGGGIASITQSYATTYDFGQMVTFPGVPVSPGVSFPVPSVSLPAGPIATNALVLTIGGGASVFVNDHLSVDVDLRSFHVRGATTGQVGRFGVGASYRF